jgi:hypothetical protein
MTMGQTRYTSGLNEIQVKLLGFTKTSCLYVLLDLGVVSSSPFPD